MDPYQGNPANDPLVIQVPDDTADQWTASVINTPTESLADSVATLRQRAAWLASANWPHGRCVWTGSQVLAAAGSAMGGTPPVWNAAYGLWIGAVTDASSYTHIAVSADGFEWEDFVQVGLGSAGFASSAVYGFVSRPTDGAFLAFVHINATSTFSATDVYSPTSTTPSAAGAAPAGGVPASGHWLSGAWFAGQWNVWTGGSSTQGPQYSAAGTSWANATTWAPPGGWTLHDRAHIVATPAVGINQILLFPSGMGPTVYMATSDGLNWSQVALPAIFPSESIIDAGYDTFTGTYYLVSGTSALTRVWTSTTGTVSSWTVSATTVGHQAYAFRANGRELVMWIGLGASNVGAGATYRGIVSVDGAATWHPLPLLSTVAPGTTVALRANGNQFIYCNASEYAPSLSAPLAPTLGV